MFSSYNDQNFCNVGIMNVKPCAIHFNDGTDYDEELHTRIPQFPNNTSNLTSNPSNSTALGSHETDTMTPQHEPEHFNSGGFTLYDDLSQFPGSQSTVDMGFPSSYRPLRSERAAVPAATLLFSTTSNTESTTSPMQTAEETPRTEGSEESNYNSGMEVEEEPEKKAAQSKYKNLYKGLLERAVKAVKSLLDPTQFDYMKLEHMKSDNQWAQEGEELKPLLRRLEELSTNLKEAKKIKEAKNIKSDLLEALASKQYSRLAAGLDGFMDEIRQHGSEVFTNFNAEFKQKISQVFFERDIETKDLFSWMLLVLIALNILPEDPERLQLLPLKKSTVCMGAWLLESPMNPETKDLYRDLTVRGHVRVVMTEIYNNLYNQAFEKLDGNTLGLLQRISNSLSTRFANVERLERSERPQKRIVRARNSPKNIEFDNGLSEKRGSSKAPVLSDVTTKKVNKQKK